MYERRLKILLGLLALATLVLLVRSAHVQIGQGTYWRQKASESMQRVQFTDTTRGAICDRNGVRLACDESCTDAAVDYRAIERDPKWIREQAIERLRKREGSPLVGADRKRRTQLIDDEIKTINSDLDLMWETLARVSGKTLEEIEQIKQSIHLRVQMRRRWVWYRKYQEASEKFESRDPDPWYRQWLITGDNAPTLDSFGVTVEEERLPHVVLRAIDDDTYATLGKLTTRCPGLVLRNGKRRVYPLGNLFCHGLGRTANVTREDLEGDPNSDNDLRQYLPNDLVGRSGVEALCEQTLRGSRGRVQRYSDRDEVIRSTEAGPGKDVYLTIDAELQAECQDFLKRKRDLKNSQGAVTQTLEELHGAIVVLDMRTNQVLAMASYPVFDLNQFDALYPLLVRDDLNKPLINRATQYPLEPGSTAKVIVGLGGVTHNYIGVADTIECTGYLVLSGIRHALLGRCWTARQYEHMAGIPFKHHGIPVPHPTGFLTFMDAIERSCNVFFETLADRMGLAELAYWFSQFGLGRPTGVGIEEASGRIPDATKLPAAAQRMNSWWAGIGQGPVAATPMQMANVAATIARNGVWMRPRLLLDEPPGAAGQRIEVGRRPRSPTTALSGQVLADSVDLHLNPDALAAVREGMYKVVNSEAGTGNFFRHDLWAMGLRIAGKTGSAQAGKLAVPVRKADGSFERDETHHVVYKIYEPNCFPWYQGTGEDHSHLAHAWFIGYAPADNPQIAFAVMVEFGGSGGQVAASVARDVLEACIERQYLSPQKEGR